MKIFLTMIIVLIGSGLCRGASDGSSDPKDQKLINWMRANTCQLTGMPYSYEPVGVRHDSFMKMGGRYSTTGIIERTIVDRGISIYDAALWQIILGQTGDPHDLMMARKPAEYYWKGALNEFSNIRAGAGGQIFVYDPRHPQAVSSDIDQNGSRGFIFRMLDAAGEYRSTDPLDGKKYYQDFPNDARIHWEDWKPIAGENAWVVMAAMHLLNQTSSEDWHASIEFNLAQELARAALYLQARNGGIRMAPLGTYYHLLGVLSDASDEEIVQNLDRNAKRFKQGISVSPEDPERLGGVDYQPYHTWYYEEISTENNLSWYAALRMLYRLTGRPQYLNGLQHIEQYLRSVWASKKKIFYQGAHEIQGVWVPNRGPFASDVQNWAIVVLGPQKIDEWFGEGSAWDIWRATKALAGIYNAGSLAGVGFSNEKDRLSIEWTAGAILAVRKLAVYYSLTHPDWAAEAGRDASSMRLGVETYHFTVRPNEEAYSYSSVRRWIPFGWFSQHVPVMSLASTAWIVMVDKNIDPFEL